MSIAEHLGRAIEKHKSKHAGKKEKKHEHPMHGLKRMEIEPEDEGDGYIITHYPESPDRTKMGGGGGTFRDSYMRDPEPTKHVAKNHKDMMKHVKEHCCPDASDVEESAVSH